MIRKTLGVAIPCLLCCVAMTGCGRTENAATGDQAASASASVPLTAEYLASLEAKDLSGSWMAGTGRGTFNVGPDGSLEIRNESNLVSRGTISDGTLTALDWKVTGRLSADKQRFVWSNGAIWRR